MNYDGQKLKNYHIRNAAAVDISRIKQIEIESEVSGWKIEEYLDELKRKDSVFLVCEVKEKVIGFAIARLIMEQKISDSLFGMETEEIEIFSIAIDKEFRKSGLGTELLRKIIDEYSKCPIYLEVRTSNISAISFYKYHDFKIISRRKNYYTLPTEDALIMMLDRGNKKSKLDYDKD